jgi:large subunit ribosomal protein L21
MYAIFADGGRQYKVSEGQVLELDFRDSTAGEVLTFDQVLAVSSEAGSKFGAPTVAGAKVEAEVIGVSQGPKITVLKFRRRKNSRRKKGHRQLYTKVKVSKIVAG